MAEIRPQTRSITRCTSAPGTRDHAPITHTEDTHVHLIPGERIHSAYAGRTGRVVKVYPDTSACVHWDDREPQAEGLGHERMPRHLLVKIEPTTPVDLASASRDFAALLASGEITIDAPEGTIATVDRFLAAVAAQPAPTSADVSVDPVDVRFALEVLRTIVDEWPDRLPADLHARATEAVERIESAPYRSGGYAGLYGAARAAEALLTRQKHLPTPHTAEGRVLLALRAALGGEA